MNGALFSLSLFSVRLRYIVSRTMSEFNVNPIVSFLYILTCGLKLGYVLHVHVHSHKVPKQEKYLESVINEIR